MQTKTLFSFHYLEHRLAEHPEWAEDPGPAFEALRRLWLRATEHGEGKRFKANKVAFARSICPHLTKENLAMVLDLGEQLETACQSIKGWNHL